MAVRPARAPEAMVRAGAGQGTVFADRAQAPDAVADSAAAWTRGVLVAEDMRVADFVAELARYRPGVLRCDRRVAELRVTGVFSLRDTDRALETSRSRCRCRRPTARAIGSRCGPGRRADARACERRLKKKKKKKKKKNLFFRFFCVAA